MDSLLEHDELNHGSFEKSTIVHQKRGNITTMVEYKERLEVAMKRAGMGAAQLAAAINMSYQGVKKVMDGKSGAFSAENNSKAAAALGVNSDWLATGDRAMGAGGVTVASAPHEAPSDDPGGPPDLVIAEFATGGGMDRKGQLLLDDQPGIIRSWRVSNDWLRLNVPSHTGTRNLCIVTGFGPSMRPMFNPGDPLLVDIGVRTVNHEGVYFFRVGEEGFIKLIQRVPEFDGPGFNLRIISKNPDFPPYDLSPRNPHFEVLGKVLTVWRSEQY